MLLNRCVRVLNTPEYLSMVASDIQYLVGGKVYVDFNWHYGEVQIRVKNDDIEYIQMSITLERYLKMKPRELLYKFSQNYVAEMQLQYDTLLKLRNERGDN